MVSGWTFDLASWSSFPGKLGLGSIDLVLVESDLDLILITVDSGQNFMNLHNFLICDPLEI